MSIVGKEVNSSKSIDEFDKSDYDIMEAEFPITIETQDDIYEIMQIKKQGFVEVKPGIWEKKK